MSSVCHVDSLLALERSGEKSTASAWGRSSIALMGWGELPGKNSNVHGAILYIGGEGGGGFQSGTCARPPGRAGQRVKSGFKYILVCQARSDPLFFSLNEDEAHGYHFIISTLLLSCITPLRYL